MVTVTRHRSWQKHSSKAACVFDRQHRRGGIVMGTLTDGDVRIWGEQHRVQHVLIATGPYSVVMCMFFVVCFPRSSSNSSPFPDENIEDHEGDSPEATKLVKTVSSPEPRSPDSWCIITISKCSLPANTCIIPLFKDAASLQSLQFSYPSQNPDSPAFSTPLM